MPRAARVVIPGCPHHITQRGNNRQDVFFVDDDRRVFLKFLRDASERFGMQIDGYCLMTNHVHLVAVPRTEDSMALTLKLVNQLYTQYVNRMQERSGHLWQDRFFSCVLDETHFYNAMAYVERNPLRAGITSDARQYPWSSAAAHCDGLDAARLVHLEEWEKQIDPKLWRERLGAGDDVSINRDGPYFISCVILGKQ